MLKHGLVPRFLYPVLSNFPHTSRTYSQSNGWMIKMMAVVVMVVVMTVMGDDYDGLTGRDEGIDSHTVPTLARLCSTLLGKLLLSLCP